MGKSQVSLSELKLGRSPQSDVTRLAVLLHEKLIILDVDPRIIVATSINPKRGGGDARPAPQNYEE
ncbi:hypothetical protein F2Q68_00008069 [Brassica cretica]|uniref:Uncharacterized protein n=1 Tax=Brassica cretica TaxID=69181 RepID=A0A8S9KUY7_BRACR|nr:hypothetical protein F2Q68_00008069 [Brassica cretica]